MNGATSCSARRRQEQQRVHALRIEDIREPRKIGFDAVEPESVGIDEKEWPIAQLRQRLGDAAAGAEQALALVGNDDTRLPARCEMPLHGVGQMMDVHHGALDAGIGETIKTVIDQRLAADRDQRLWDVAVIGPHARAKPRCQHYRAFRHHSAARPAIPRIAIS
jgi:hypothetical protein